MPIFRLTLHPTYLKQGFFNVTVAFDKYVRQSEGPVELVLVADDRERRLEAKVDRRAQTKTRAARIMGGAKLGEWFAEHFDVLDRLDVDLSSLSEIRIQRSTSQ